MTYNTEKRTELLNFLKSNAQNTYTAEEICDSILESGKGKSTVYRQIAKLVEEGYARRITDGRTRRVTYQYVDSRHCAHHLHLKCKECGTLIHLDSETSSVLLDKIKNIQGFAIELGALIYGVCEGCGIGREGDERA